MTYWEAHAILDMDDHGYSESLGPHKDETKDAWAGLVTQAEKLTGRWACNTPLEKRK
jgi:hypothetical protein